MPNYVSAADFANSPEQKAKEQKAFAYQAANPSTSSYMPQANDPGSAAYRPPTAVPNMSAANANERSAMDSFRANPGSALSQMQNLAGTYAERMKSGDTAGAKTVQDYANSISKVAGVTPQSFSFSGVTAPQAYNPNVNYSSNTPMPQNNAVSTPGMMSAPKLGGNQQTPAVTPMAYSPNMGNNYGMGSFEQSQFGMPQTASGSSTTKPFVSAYDVTAAQKSASEQAAARLAKMQLGVQQGVDKYNTARKNAYDYANQTTKDNRVLAADMFNRNSNPYAGSTDYKQAQILRSNNLEDTAANNNYQADISASNQKLSDFMQAAPEQQQAMYDQLLQQLQNTANQQDQISLQARGQDMSQANADRSFNYGVGQDKFKNGLSQAQLSLQQQGQAYNQNLQTNQFIAGRQDTTYNQGQKQIENNAQYGGVYQPYSQEIGQMNKNSQSWFNASPAEKQRLADQNQLIASKIGATKDANGDWVMPQAKPTPAAQNQQFNQNLAANELKFKVDSYKQKFDEDVRQFDTKTALDNAYKQGQLTIDQYNSATSRMNANTSASNATNSASSKLTDQLLDSWKASGKAPAGLEKLGVQPGQAYNDGKASQVKVADVIDQLNKSTFVTPSHQGERPTTYDPVGLAKSILSRGMTKQENDYLFSYYNIDTKSVLEQLNKSGN